MIRVERHPKPPTFDKNVRKPGQAFLKKRPRPSSWEGYEYWRTSKPDLYRLYKGICAFTGLWIPNGTGASSVEHFKPKSKYPKLAYEWENFRLACALVNSFKGDHEDVLDPFTIQNGWFTLDFDSCLVKPRIGLSKKYRDAVQRTIDRLHLNDDRFVNDRVVWRDEFQRNADFESLCRFAPFLAIELERQGLRE